MYNTSDSKTEIRDLTVENQGENPFVKSTRPPLHVLITPEPYNVAVVLQDYP